MTFSSPTNFYLDLNQFSDMKLGARQDSADASKSVAQQFEGLFIQQMLAAMRSAAVVDESSHSSYMDFYQEMQDKQLALTMAQGGGLGISKFIIQQLPGGQGDSGNSGEVLPLHKWQVVIQTPQLKEMDYQSENPAVVVNEYIADDIPIGQNRWPNAASFASDILPQAQRASATLGISAELLVAQAALETGWGRHTMTHTDGSLAYNLFGIKASTDWRGDIVTRPTLEFRQGVMQTEVAQFRAYASAEESINDYVQFIQSNKRYENALQHGGDDSLYLKEIHRAGYATDPNYVDKVLSIMHSDSLQQNLNGGSTHA
ncbi:MAG: flagellar assembly peptidoglycan hydrolase FlgJ [Gammaproteobacteria bacterium]|nr:flagellar assembly peptidoglycan hydrolase FlgJ [Gammaproteobacteria bacterium]